MIIVSHDQRGVTDKLINNYRAIYKNRFLSTTVVQLRLNDTFRLLDKLSTKLLSLCYLR